MTVVTTPRAATPASATPASSRELPPANKIYQEFGRDLLALPGVLWMGYASAKPTTVHVVFEQNQFEQLARNILRENIDGISFDLKTVSPAKSSGKAPATSAISGAAQVQPEGAGDWQHSVSNMARAVSGLPGVWNRESTRSTITFHTVTKAQAEHLTRLVKPALGNYAINFTQRSA